MNKLYISPQWISVKERLPKRNQNVLLFTKRDFKEDDKVVKGWRDAYGFASAECHEEEDIFPTHWMPLPEPPKQ